MKVKAPPIKSQGIKTKLVPLIKKCLPEFEGKYIEPFMGTGVVAFNLLPERAILADSNPHIINFYQSLNNGEFNSGTVRRFLEDEGEKLLSKGEDHYYFIRDRFNESGNPLDFLFLSRSCFNGMMRFNKSGGYNVPFCRKPDRFRQAYVTKIVNQVKYVEKVLSVRDWMFINASYEETITKADPEDFIYCDPPYVGRHVDYFDSWDKENEQKLHDVLVSSGAKFLLSTWHSNKYRENECLEEIWGEFDYITKEHFYHVGAKESNRNSMLEALVMNYRIEEIEEEIKLVQSELFN